MLVLVPPGLDSGLLGFFWDSSGAAVWGAEPVKNIAKCWFWASRGVLGWLPGFSGLLLGILGRPGLDSGLLGPSAWTLGFKGFLGWIVASRGLLGWILARKCSKRVLWRLPGGIFWPGLRNALKWLSGGLLEQFSGTGCEMLYNGSLEASWSHVLAWAAKCFPAWPKVT